MSRNIQKMAPIMLDHAGWERGMEVHANDVMVEVLSSPEFTNLKNLFANGTPDRVEFDALPMPKGLSADGAWDLIQCLRMQDMVSAGDVDAVFLDAGKNVLPSWFTWGKTLVYASHQVSDLVSSGSFLDVYVRELKRSERFLLTVRRSVPVIVEAEGCGLLAEEAIALLDGKSEPASAYGAMLSRLRRYILEGKFERLRLESPEDLIDLYIDLFHPGEEAVRYIDRGAINHVSTCVKRSFRKRYCINAFMAPVIEMVTSIAQESGRLALARS